jgi:ABC-2 type transport system ATP-binding protein
VKPQQDHAEAATPRQRRAGSGPVNVIEVRDLVKRYRTAAANAVDGVSFDVAAGQFFCLLGPNGAGKTSIVSVLTTTLALTSGAVLIAGYDLATEPGMVRQAQGIVFQQPSLDLNLTAEENVRLHAVTYGLYPWRPLFSLMAEQYRRQVDELAGVMGLTECLSRPARALSGGMRRKLEIVRALMHRPQVLFLDEPTVGLDPESRRSLWAYLEDIRQRTGTAIVLTTHYLDEAETADTVCVVSRGKIIERGSPGEVKARHLRPELVLDSRDRHELWRELVALGLQATGTGPLRVRLDGRSAQSIVAHLDTELTRFHIAEPTLEDAYLQLMERAP